ncbi:RidA family protein [Mangrovicoccus algicola]|uniref:RidA family protein n=1 Tax=Mangrovicoccus algicola TaxID=2771008 RepID=A0A8J6YWZ1_9RHOB|nr:RidA family protein [Mangrovicoccus algicola]MBE3637804.1 RidA family protein [Mangrovicoccus algicola]
MKRIFSGSPFEPKIAYCRAVVAGGFAFVSGTTGIDPEGPAEQSAADQCRLTLTRIAAALAEAGSGLDRAVRVTYYMQDIAEFESCWPVLQEHFGANPPAASVIEARLIDPAMKIEIEVTALA